MGGRENPEPLKNFPLLSLGNAVSDHSGKKNKRRKIDYTTRRVSFLKIKEILPKNRQRGKHKTRVTSSPFHHRGYWDSTEAKLSKLLLSKEGRKPRDRKVRECVV